MALPDSHVVQVGTAIVLGNSATHSPAAANDLGGDTDQIDLTSVADTAARESAKIDFGASRARIIYVYAAFEFAATPVAGEVVELYFAPSISATASAANPGGVSGSDGAYTGTSGSTLAESVLQLQKIGEFICTDDATGTVQISYVGSFIPPTRYGTIVVKNESGAAFHSDVVETSILLTPNNDVTID